MTDDLKNAIDQARELRQDIAETRADIERAFDAAIERLRRIATEPERPAKERDE